MLFRFIGTYTGGRSTVDAGGVTFEGTEPSKVTDPDLIRRLSSHVEFEEVHPLDHDGDGHLGGSLPKKRGRPKKAQDDG